MDVRKTVREIDYKAMLRRPETRIGGALLVMVASIWAFVEIADAVNERETSAFDRAIMLAMREGPNNAEIAGPFFVEKFAKDLTTLGGYPFVVLLTFIVIGYLVLNRHIRHAVEVTLSVAGGAAIVMGLKELFGRARPEIVPPMYEVATWSFPSGHSSTAAVVFLTLGILIARFVTRKRLTLYVIGVAFLLTFIVGWSRVALGVHYPTDVLAGWAMGLTWALFSWLVVNFWENWKSRPVRARREAEMYEDTEAEVTHMPRETGEQPT
ncbi:phosphatase PAP2 family protein [Persicimonas caeni]|nr:phosphatase PAP2 family protein [Persicimonas caeni]